MKPKLIAKMRLFYELMIINPSQVCDNSCNSINCPHVNLIPLDICSWPTLWYGVHWWQHFHWWLLWVNWNLPKYANMMTSSNGNIFSVTGPLCGEFIGHLWIPPYKGQWRGALMFSLICAWTNGWDTIETPMIWDAMALIMAPLLCSF